MATIYRPWAPELVTNEDLWTANRRGVCGTTPCVMLDKTNGRRRLFKTEAAAQARADSLNKSFGGQA